MRSPSQTTQRRAELAGEWRGKRESSRQPEKKVNFQLREITGSRDQIPAALRGLRSALRYTRPIPLGGPGGDRPAWRDGPRGQRGRSRGPSFSSSSTSSLPRRLSHPRGCASPAAVPCAMPGPAPAARSLPAPAVGRREAVPAGEAGPAREDGPSGGVYPTRREQFLPLRTDSARSVRAAGSVPEVRGRRGQRGAEGAAGCAGTAGGQRAAGPGLPRLGAGRARSPGPGGCSGSRAGRRLGGGAEGGAERAERSRGRCGRDAVPGAAPAALQVRSRRSGRGSPGAVSMVLHPVRAAEDARGWRGHVPPCRAGGDGHHGWMDGAAARPFLPP